MRRRVSPVPADTFVVGIDIAKRRFVAVVQAGDAMLSKAKSFAMSREGFESFEAFVLKSTVGAPWVAAFEPTGHYGDPLVHWLHDGGRRVFQVQPLHTKRSKELYDGTRRKTDSKDAVVVADLCRRGICKPSIRLESPFAELRVLCRHREQLVKRKSQLQNRIHWQLDVVFPELIPLFNKVDSAGFRCVLELAPTPTDALLADPKVLADALRKATRGGQGEETAQQIIDAASSSVGVDRALDARRLALKQLLGELVSVQVLVDEVGEAMKTALDCIEYAPRLVAIPRLGWLTVAILLAEMGDLRGYRFSKQVIAMAGLDLVELSSGERQGHRHISRRGRRYVRQILYLAVLRMGWNILSEPRRRLVEENKLAPTKAAVANICRLLRIVHAMVRDRTAFDASLLAAKGGTAMA
jgi:transposase